MVTSFVFLCKLLLLLSISFSVSDSPVRVFGSEIGINYGRIADNLPPPSSVASLLKSLNIRRVKIYDSNPEVLTAFANTDIALTIGLDEPLESMTDPVNARNWVGQKVKPYVPGTRIACIVVGNEVFSTGDGTLISNVLPAMRNVHNALKEHLLDQQVTVTTAHAFDVLSSSFPPSSGSFKQEAIGYLKPILEFQTEIGSPFLINIYPYFAYKENPSEIPLDYVLSQPNARIKDPSTRLHYDNMLFAQIDAVRSAIKSLGFTNIEIIVSETGWPSVGDADEPGATPENARLYNGNLLRLVQGKRGTPLNPNAPISAYIFALFNENTKPGPTSERNFGLYYPNLTQVYDIGLKPHGSQISAASRVNVFYVMIFAVSCLTLA